MTGKKAFLYLQSAICVLFVALLIAGAVGILREGTAKRAEDPLAWIYNADAVARRAGPALAVGLIGLTMTAVGLALGIGGDKADAPAGKRSAKVARPAPVAQKPPFKGLNAVRWAVLAAAVACIAAGAINGTMGDVLAKAIRVCSECIGLG